MHVQAKGHYKTKANKKAGTVSHLDNCSLSVLLSGVTQAYALQRGRYCMGDSHLLLLLALLHQDLFCLYLPFFSVPLSPLTLKQKKGL